MSTEIKTHGNPTEGYGYTWEQFANEHGLEAGKERRRPIKALRNLARKALEAVAKALPQVPAEKRQPITMDHIMHGLEQPDAVEELKGYQPDNIGDNGDPNVIGSAAYYARLDNGNAENLVHKPGNIVGVDDHNLRSPVHEQTTGDPADRMGVITAPHAPSARVQPPMGSRLDIHEANEVRTAIEEFGGDTPTGTVYRGRKVE